jgi:hypothetical protein
MESRSAIPDAKCYDTLTSLKEQGNWIERYPDRIRLSIEGLIPNHNLISVREYERVITELKVTDSKFAYNVAARVLNYQHANRNNQYTIYYGITSSALLCAMREVNTRLFGFIGSFSVSELASGDVHRGLTLLYAFKLLVENKLDETAVNMINTLGVATKSCSQLFTPPSLLSNHQGECYISGKPFDQVINDISQVEGFTLTDALKNEAYIAAIELLKSFKYDLSSLSQKMKM